MAPSARRSSSSSDWTTSPASARLIDENHQASLALPDRLGVGDLHARLSQQIGHRHDDRATEHEGQKAQHVGGLGDGRDEKMREQAAENHGKQAAGKSADQRRRGDRRKKRDVNQPSLERAKERGAERDGERASDQGDAQSPGERPGIHGPQMRENTTGGARVSRSRLRSWHFRHARHRHRPFLQPASAAIVVHERRLGRVKILVLLARRTRRTKDASNGRRAPPAGHDHERRSTA